MAIIKSSKEPLTDPKMDAAIRKMIVEAYLRENTLLVGVIKALSDKNLSPGQIKEIGRQAGSKNPDAWAIIAEEYKKGNI